MEIESNRILKYSNNKGFIYILNIIRNLMGKVDGVDKTDPVDDWAKSIDKLPKPVKKPPVKKDGNMDDKKILKMCKNIAFKYNRPYLHEDIMSECVLECYEQIEIGNTHPANLHRMANRRVHDFVNLKSLPVSVPIREEARTIARGNEVKVTSMNENGIENLSNAVRSTYIDIEGYETQTQDHAIKYESDEYFNHIVKVAKFFLTPTQWKIIQMKYLQDMFQVDIADELECTQQYISQEENKALETICNKSLLVERGKIVLYNKYEP